MSTLDHRNTPEAIVTAHKYADILHRSRPNSEASRIKHPRMTLENRAKIFSPFAALRGYEEKVAVEGWKMQRVPKVELTEGETAILNEKLLQLAKGMHISVRFFLPDDEQLGTYQTAEGLLEAIDPIGQFLRISGTIIAFDQILDLEEVV